MTDKHDLIDVLLLGMAPSQVRKPSGVPFVQSDAKQYTDLANKYSNDVSSSQQKMAEYASQPTSIDQQNHYNQAARDKQQAESNRSWAQFNAQEDAYMAGIAQGLLKSAAKRAEAFARLKQQAIEAARKNYMEGNWTAVSSEFMKALNADIQQQLDEHMLDVYNEPKEEAIISLADLILWARAMERESPEKPGNMALFRLIKALGRSDAYLLNKAIWPLYWEAENMYNQIPQVPEFIQHCKTNTSPITICGKFGKHENLEFSIDFYKAFHALLSTEEQLDFIRYLS